jgi:DNA-binding LacI/PurR family transcriptional regulator
MRGNPSVTLEDVARVAGVSRATVSRVINDTRNVDPALRELVERAVAQTGYVPNRAARSLVTRRTDSIALVVSEAERRKVEGPFVGRIFTDPFFGRVVTGMLSVLRPRGIQMVLMLADDAQSRTQLLGYLRQGHVDGVILVSLHGADPLPRALTGARIPAVLFGRPRAGERLPSVDADNRGGALLATGHLLSQGRRKVATITGPLDMAVAEDRLDGYTAALAEHGVRLRKGLVANGDFSPDSGRRAMAALLRRHPDLDGVFAANDLMAVGALQALAAAGRLVPSDVAVVGFDDMPEARSAEPPLTTVRQPLAAMTRAMTGLLLRCIEGTVSEDEHLVFPTRLVSRATA